MMKLCTSNPEHTFADADEDMLYCSKCGSYLIESNEPIQLEIYLHSNKEAMWDAGADVGLGAEALQEFQGTAYEVTLSLIVNPITGIAKCYELNGVKLNEPVKV